MLVFAQNLQYATSVVNFFCEILVMSEEELPPAKSFSPILIEEYIRLMTAAHYIRSEDKSGSIQFKIAPDDFKAVQECHIQAPLIGLTLQYNEDSGVLTVTGSEEFTQMYENKIQEEVALNFEIVNKQRYAQWINPC